MRRILCATIAAVALALPALAHHPGPRGGFSFGIFYSSLEPHGRWIPVEGGFYAWQPIRVHPGWRPYFAGRWIWTELGWYWLSEEPWGWATYHYGRWHYDDYYGWVWIPGSEWAPAWVEWRFGDGFVGWAPLGPYALFDFAVGVHYRVRWITPHFYWSFVDCGMLAIPSVHHHVHRHEGNRRYIGSTRPAGSVGVSRGRVLLRGPERSAVEAAAGAPVPRTYLVDAEHEGESLVPGRSGEAVRVFRPELRAVKDEATRPAAPSGGRRIVLEPRAVPPAQEGSSPSDAGSAREPERERGLALPEGRSPERSPGWTPGDRDAGPGGRRPGETMRTPRPEPRALPPARGGNPPSDAGSARERTSPEGRSPERSPGWVPGDRDTGPGGRRPGETMRTPRPEPRSATPRDLSMERSAPPEKSVPDVREGERDARQSGVSPGDSRSARPDRAPEQPPRRGKR
ncbi:MAG: DUF6600 domain-containing protein [Bacteroidota bacterium]